MLHIYILLALYHFNRSMLHIYILLLWVYYCVQKYSHCYTTGSGINILLHLTNCKPIVVEWTVSSSSPRSPNTGQHFCLHDELCVSLFCSCKILYSFPSLIRRILVIFSSSRKEGLIDWLIDWLIGWLVLSANFSSISTIS